MPSMMGSSPVWSIQGERVVRRGWIRSQAIARVVPYRSVTCVVAAPGSPQVSGLAKPAAPASREGPAGLPSSIRRSTSVRQRHGEIHLDELSREAQLGDAQERAGGGERRAQGRLGEPTPCGSENVPLIAPHVDH